MTVQQIYATAVIWLLSATGILTSFSDIHKRKIKNQTLIALGLLALSAHIWFYVSVNTIPWLLVFSTMAAAAAGFLCFLGKIWRPGDAKLFILYAFLMPLTAYDKIFPLPCITLFIHAFLTSLLFLMPTLIHAIFLKRDNLLKQLFRIKTVHNLVYSFFITSVLSWAIFPFFSLFKIPPRNPVVICIIFLLYKNIFNLTPSQPRFKILISIFAISGLVLQAWNSPDFFSGEKIIRFLVWLVPFAILSQMIKDLASYIKEAEARVPFSPFLLVGCALSYMPPLLWFMSLIHR